MTETYAEVPSKYERREPKLAWLAMRIFYVIAICTYLAMCVNEAVVWGLYGGFVSIPAEQAVLFDRVMAMLSVAVAPIYVLCAICTLFVLYRLVAKHHLESPAPEAKAEES